MLHVRMGFCKVVSMLCHVCLDPELKSCGRYSANAWDPVQVRVDESSQMEPKKNQGSSNGLMGNCPPPW